MEYLLLIFEFYYAKSLKGLIGILLIPIILSISIYWLTNQKLNVQQLSDISTNILTLLGILLGFTISFFAILLTSSSLNIRKAQITFIEKTLFQKRISIYDIMLTGIAYSIVIQCLLLIVNLISLVWLSDTLFSKKMIAINIGIISHIVIVLLKSVLDFYFAFTRKN